MIFTLDQALQNLQTYKYAIIIPVGIIEGPILSVLCGFLIKLKTFEFWPVYLSVIAADLIGDVLWYCVGRFGARGVMKKFGHMVNLGPKVMEKFEEKFKKHEGKTMLISKMTNGFGFSLVVLTMAGTLKVDFKKYMLYNAIGGFVWSGILLVFGYFFGQLYQTIDKAFQIYFLLVVLAIVIATLYGLQKVMRKAALSGKI